MTDPRDTILPGDKISENARHCIQEAVNEARIALDQFDECLWRDKDLEDLYQRAKPVHTAALGIWSTICQILQSQTRAERETQRQGDEINLEELFTTR